MMKKRIMSASRITTKPFQPMATNMNTEIKPKFVKMDARYTGYPNFKYMVEFINLHRINRIKAFNDFRDWCVETWGKSVEREQYLFVDDPRFQGVLQLNPAWCWHTDDHKLNIYLRGDEEKVWAELRWK
jgi:hypothetical protein